MDFFSNNFFSAVTFDNYFLVLLAKMENDSGEFEESHDLRNDEDDEFNFGGSPDYYNNMSTDLAQTQVLHNQRADEAVELSDQDNSMDESIISAVANIPPRPSSQLAHNRPSNSI